MPTTRVLPLPTLLLALVVAVLTVGCSLPDRMDASERREPAVGRTFRDCDIRCPEMVVVPAGGFRMGSPVSEPDRDEAEGPQHRVSLRRFAMGRFDVTRGEWSAFVAATDREIVGGCAWAGPSGRKPDPDRSWQNVDGQETDRHPVVCVTWYDAQAYVQWLTKQTGRHYRLPTEAEWEYAARGGTTSAFPSGAHITHDLANYGAEKCCSGLAEGGDRWVTTSPVGAFPPNPFGLFDMQGNVLQWVQDCLSDYADLSDDGRAYEVASPLRESGFLLPGMAGKSACDYRMLRGGDWGDPPSMLRSAFRNYGPPRGATLENYWSAGVGFRVVRSLDD